MELKAGLSSSEENLKTSLLETARAKVRVSTM